MFSPERRLFALLLATAAAALFLFLGSRGLNEPDEGRYAELGREMAVSGDWLVPHLNGFEHFQKPPVLYWATAASITLFGANEWAARLPPALAAFGTVLLTVWLGGALFSRRTGLLAGFILLSSLGFFVMARLLTVDMMLTFWVTAASAAFVRYAQGGGRRWAWLYFVFVGVGFLAKGPLAFVIPIAAAAAWQLSARRHPEGARPLPWGRGLLLSLLLGLSWFIALSFWRHDLFQYFTGYELLDRFASSHHGRSKPFWFFAPVLLAVTVPWVFLFPQLGLTVWRQQRAGLLRPAKWLLLGWVIVPFLILSLSGSKLPTYLLPLQPALALAFAAFVTRGARPAAWVPVTAWVTLAVFVVGAALFPRFNDRLGPQATLRDLLRPIAADPAYARAHVYVVEVRAHGVEFYLQRLVSLTREQADIVLAPTPQQESRLLSTNKFSAEALEAQPDAEPVLAIVRHERQKGSFPAKRWQELGHAGDFVLLKLLPLTPPALVSASR